MVDQKTMKRLVVNSGKNILLNMRVAVTGNSGFIGSNLVKRLDVLGIHVISLDIKNGIDVADWDQCQNINEFDVIVHLAAKSYVPDSFKYPREFYYNNIISTVNVLELCRQFKAKMIFGSSYIYGSPIYLPVDENHPVKPHNPYSQSKIIGEDLCKGYHNNFRVPIIILRPFNVYGKGQNENFLIPNIITKAKLGKIDLHDPEPKRDFIYIDDVVRAFIKAIEYKNASFNVFNIGFGKSYSVKKIVNIIVKNFNHRIEVNFSGNRRINEVNNTVANINKAKNLLGWTPDITLEDGIARVMAS